VVVANTALELFDKDEQLQGWFGVRPEEVAYTRSELSAATRDLTKARTVLGIPFAPGGPPTAEQLNTIESGLARARAFTDQMGAAVDGTRARVEETKRRVDVWVRWAAVAVTAIGRAGRGRAVARRPVLVAGAARPAGVALPALGRLRLGRGLARPHAPPAAPSRPTPARPGAQPDEPVRHVELVPREPVPGRVRRLVVVVVPPVAHRQVPEHHVVPAPLTGGEPLPPHRCPTEFTANVTWNTSTVLRQYPYTSPFSPSAA
jgi:hypothetical protein